MKTKNTLAIHFNGLSPKETALFERVISFNVTHGLQAEIVTDADIADLIITTVESYSSITENMSKTLVVITNDETDTQGDLQLSRPLMITKAMVALTEGVKLVNEKQSDATADESTALLDVNIDNVEENVVENIVENVDKSPTEALTDETLVTEIVKAKVETASHHALIIDDSAAIRKQLELELRDAGISSDFAECGEDALEKIKSNHFDLVFLDIIMPGMDGYETCKAMRSNLAYKKTPIIMLSGKTSPLDEVQGVIAGATTYLTKPVKSDKLQETLNRVTKWIENYAPPRQTESV